MKASIERVDASLTRPLRQEVLRRGYPASSTTYPGDDDTRTAHFCLRLLAAGKAPSKNCADGIVAVGTVLADAPPWDPERPEAWRIRGMATHPDFRGHGYGSIVLEALIDHARSSGGHVIWCHARVDALGLYRRAGFEPIGDVFDDGFAIHQSMWRSLP